MGRMELCDILAQIGVTAKRRYSVAEKENKSREDRIEMESGSGGWRFRWHS